jgi:2,4-dienoyl-CoA reductase-like NADH-dependent reductase (Old Yellow Enzyme family)/thioredoxin reductase
MGQFDKIFEPLTIKQVTLRNRIVSTSHSEVYAKDGLPTDRLAAYHAEKARGGIAMTMCGGSSPVSLDSPIGWWNSLNIATDAVIPGLRKVADAVHEHGGAITIQLTHMGRRNRWDGFDWPNLLSPSGQREPVHRANCKVMEIEDIKRVIGDFGRAAVRVREAGLDGIEISAAHQHLVDQFWSPLTNFREDDYGGSFENRMRFGIEVFEEIRRTVGDDYMVGMRMCGDEFHEGAMDQQEMLRIARYYTDTGLIDFISVIGSGADTNALSANLVPNMAYPPAPFLHLASAIKAEVDVPVIHAQNIKDPVSAARILEEGHVDLVGMTRAHIADPHLVNKTREGRVDQIRLCVGANYCINRMYAGLDVACSQNAAVGREATMPHKIERADARRRVVVVGGGPGGMEAARVCSERGHEVILLERSAALGGQINLAAMAPARDQMTQITRWLAMELDRLGTDIRFNTEADAAGIRELQPDIVVLATGGRPNLDGFASWREEPGLRVASTHEIFSGEAEPGQNVLIYDVIGTHAGATCADFLAGRGALVEIVSPDMSIGEDLGGTVRPVYNKRLLEKEVIFTPNFALHQIYREDDKLVAVLRNEYTGQEEERVVDQIIVENGVTPDETLYYELKAGSRNHGQVDLEALYAARPQPEPEFDGDYLLYRVGDCVSARDIHAAIYDSLRLCKDF